MTGDIGEDFGAGGECTFVLIHQKPPTVREIILRGIGDKYPHIPLIIIGFIVINRMLEKALKALKTGGLQAFT